MHIHRESRSSGCCQWCGRRRSRLYAYAHAYGGSVVIMAAHSYCSLVHFFRYYNS